MSVTGINDQGLRYLVKVGRHFGLTSFLFKKFFGNPLQKNCFATVSEERESYSKFDQSNIKSLFLELLTFQCIFWMKKDKKKSHYILYIVALKSSGLKTWFDTSMLLSLLNMP